MISKYFIAQVLGIIVGFLNNLISHGRINPILADCMTSNNIVVSDKYNILIRDSFEKKNDKQGSCFELAGCCYKRVYYIILYVRNFSLQPTYKHAQFKYSVFSRIYRTQNNIFSVFVSYLNSH